MVCKGQGANTNTGHVSNDLQKKLAKDSGSNLPQQWMDQL